MVSVLEKTHKDTNKFHKDLEPTYYKFGDMINDEEKIARVLWEEFKERNISRISDLVHGQLRKDYKCD